MKYGRARTGYEKLQILATDHCIWETVQDSAIVSADR